MKTVLYGDDSFILYCFMSFLSQNRMSPIHVNELNRCILKYNKKISSAQLIIVVISDYINVLDTIKLINEATEVYNKTPFIIIVNNPWLNLFNYLLSGSNINCISSNISISRLRMSLRSILSDEKVDNISRYSLTNREKIVLTNLLKGKKVMEISYLLNIETKTVHGYKYAIMRKMGLKNTYQLNRIIIGSSKEWHNMLDLDLIQ